MPITTRTSNNALSLEGTGPSGTPVPADRRSADTPGGHRHVPSAGTTGPDRTDPLRGACDRRPARRTGDSTVELLPTVEAVRSHLRTTETSAIVDAAEVGQGCGRFEPHHPHRHSEPFVGGRSSTGRQLKRCGDDAGFVGSADDPVAVGGRTESTGSPGGETVHAADRTGFKGARQIDPYGPRTMQERMDSGTVFNITCSRRPTPRAGFKTRAGTDETGWCDVSSISRSRHTDHQRVPRWIGGESFLAAVPGRPPMLQEDGIGVAEWRHGSFRELYPGAPQRRTRKAPAQRVHSEMAANPADDPRGADPRHRCGSAGDSSITSPVPGCESVPAARVLETSPDDAW